MDLLEDFVDVDGEVVSTLLLLAFLSAEVFLASVCCPLLCVIYSLLKADFDFDLSTN